LKLTCDGTLSKFAFKFNLRLYILVNGMPWPKHHVYAGYMYRARMLGSGISRSNRISLTGRVLQPASPKP
jgi:hypothetical protein